MKLELACEYNSSANPHAQALHAFFALACDLTQTPIPHAKLVDTSKNNGLVFRPLSPNLVL